MKTFKTKTYDYKQNGNHVKLQYQWYRGHDVEVTLIVVKGAQKHLSGFFAIAPTKDEALQKLWEFCCHYYRGSGKEVAKLLPWHELLKKDTK